MSVAVVVPSIREEQLREFRLAWDHQFTLHGVKLYVVQDGYAPTVSCYDMSHSHSRYEYRDSVSDAMGAYSELIYSHNDGVRNLGFAAAWRDGADVIISLDDDVRPCGDTIGNHLKALNQRVPVSYMNSVDDVYMRGFPYHARHEAEVVFSHGLWHDVYDLDASTQLVLGTPQPRHRQMPVPKGVLMPVCVMNVAFKASILPWYYQAPMYDTINRFADIWSGWEVKRAIDEQGLAMVNGYATVYHSRASNPFVNLVKEARGVGMNETYGTENEDPYFKRYRELQKLWREFLDKKRPVVLGVEGAQ